MAKKIRIKQTFDLKRLANNVDNIVIEGLNLQGRYLNDDIQNGIDLSEDINGKRFKPLSMIRKQQRARKNQGSKPLEVTGTMRKTRFTRAKLGNPVVKIEMIGKNKQGEFYGAYHNKGGGSLPRRKWFGITKAMRPGGNLNEKAMALMRLHIRRKWSKKLGL